MPRENYKDRPRIGVPIYTATEAPPGKIEWAINKWLRGKLRKAIFLAAFFLLVMGLQIGMTLEHLFGKEIIPEFLRGIARGYPEAVAVVGTKVSYPYTRDLPHVLVTAQIKKDLDSKVKLRCHLIGLISGFDYGSGSGVLHARTLPGGKIAAGSTIEIKLVHRDEAANIPGNLSEGREYRCKVVEAR